MIIVILLLVLIGIISVVAVALKAAAKNNIPINNISTGFAAITISQLPTRRNYRS